MLRLHTRIRRATLLLILLALSGLTACGAPDAVNVYSARQEALIQPLLERFTAETGIPVNLVTGNGDALLARLENEGDNSPADLFLTSDAGNLYRAQAKDLLQPVTSPALQ
ncbi:MAG TPA: Fe(3+) ABC transporter substrate-binding protein, partial [Halieaceae bacterium]|nr:Fe(3+) ABC transporter substrate-binding protein [Halieaceae bacterium]